MKLVKFYFHHFNTNKKARDLKKNIYCFIEYAKVFDCVDHNKVWKILQEIGIPDQLTCSWEISMQFKKQQLEPDMKQWTASKSGKEYIKAVYCHPAYLTYMQSTSCEMLDWVKHKLESKLPGETSITSQKCRWYHHLAESKEGLKSFLMRVKEEIEKVGLKFNIQKTKIMASGPIISWQTDGETVETVVILLWGGFKSWQMMIAAMKLKDAYSLEGKLWPT